MKSLSVFILTAGAGLCFTVLWLLFGRSHSPRFESLEPHVGRVATRAEFVAIIREQQFPFETEDDPYEMVELRVPLDGTMVGKRLQLRFEPTGELRWAAVIDGAGAIVQVLFHVRKA